MDNTRTIKIEDIDDSMRTGDICSVEGKQGYVLVILPKAKPMKELTGWTADGKVFIDPRSANHRNCDDKDVAVVVHVTGSFMDRSGGNWKSFKIDSPFPEFEEIDLDRLIKYKPEKNDGQDHRITGIKIPKKLPSLRALN